MIRMQKTLRRMLVVSLALSFAAPQKVLAEQPAKQAFGSQALPADAKPQSVGFYSRGCMAGAVAIPVDGPDWQVMRLSRNRRWGHPALIATIEKLSIKARQDGWNGLMVGDISQPRGGPMLTGHASHQIGLDADLWFMPMPKERLNYQQREELSAVSVLKDKSNYVDDKRWTRAHEALLRNAANFPDVERILVHPGVKKKLCDTVKGDRSWLAKVRPFYGHNYHFHLRIGCQDGSPACKKQAEVVQGEGCDKSLQWWFDVALAPKKKAAKPDKPEKPPRPMMVSDLPAACAQILGAPAKSPQKAEYKIRETAFAAPPLDMPAFDPVLAAKSRPIEAKGPVAASPAPVAQNTDPSAATDGTRTEAVPVPVRRPKADVGG